MSELDTQMSNQQTGLQKLMLSAINAIEAPCLVTLCMLGGWCSNYTCLVGLREQNSNVCHGIGPLRSRGFARKSH